MKRKGKACKKAKKKRSGPDALDVVMKANLANILRKQKAGKTLTAREEKFLKEALRKPADAVPAEPERMWLTVSEFLRWVETQGIQISRKNLYKTYLDPETIQRNADGKIHREKALETIRLVQNKDTSATDTVMRRRQEAAVRVAEARASTEEMALAKRRMELVEVGLVERIWGEAVEGIKTEDRMIEHNLPCKLVGLAEDEIKAHLQNANKEKWRHLMVKYEK